MHQSIRFFTHMLDKVEKQKQKKRRASFRIYLTV